MSQLTTLQGITWNHSRAFPPLVAAAQRYAEMHPEINVEWRKRSLHEFGHADVSTLAASFDLIVIDHPWAGEVLAKCDLLPLEGRLDKGLQKKMEENTVSPSFESYVLDGRLIAFPIDVATQVASCRADILDRIGAPVPTTWQEVIALAQQGRVLIPGFHVDVLLTFLGFCVSLGAETFTADGIAVPSDIGRECLQRMKELSQYLPDETWEYNPIAVYERMSAGEQFTYCPFAYGYQNYSRAGFARHRLQFANLVTLPDGKNLRGVLGGTGIAISAKCDAPDAAIAFCSYVASEECQKSVYFLSGGQPAHAAVWNNPLANEISSGFFQATYRSTAEAWIRPRYNGYVRFQETAGVPIVEYLRRGGDESKVLDALNATYRESIATAAQG
jgi:multiple sugar transport system substrate-binding protein